MGLVVLRGIVESILPCAFVWYNGLGGLESFAPGEAAALPSSKYGDMAFNRLLVPGVATLNTSSAADGSNCGGNGGGGSADAFGFVPDIEPFRFRLKKDEGFFTTVCA